MKKLLDRLKSSKARAYGQEIDLTTLLMSLNQVELEEYFDGLYETCLQAGHDFKEVPDAEFENEHRFG